MWPFWGSDYRFLLSASAEAVFLSQWLEGCVFKSLNCHKDTDEPDECEWGPEIYLNNLRAAVASSVRVSEYESMQACK